MIAGGQDAETEILAWSFLGHAMKKMSSMLAILLFCLSSPNVSLSNDCKDLRPRFGSLYPDPHDVPLRTTFVLGSHHPRKVYYFLAFTYDAFFRILIDSDFRVVWAFFTPPIDGQDQPCPDKEGEMYRAAVRDWLIQEQHYRPDQIRGTACGNRGTLTRLQEYLYLEDLPDGRPLGSIAQAQFIHEPETSYVRFVFALWCEILGGPCSLMDPWHREFRGAALIDLFEYPEVGRPLRDVLSGTLIHEMGKRDVSLYGPEVPDNFRAWFEAALEECDPVIPVLGGYNRTSAESLTPSVTESQAIKVLIGK